MMGFYMRTANIILLYLLAMALLVGCAVQTQPEPEVAKYFNHEVRYSGETLGLISAWYTGKTSNWTSIEAANPGLSPTRIRLGDVIKIPEELVTRSEALPKSYLSASRKISVAPASEKKPQVKKEKPVELVEEAEPVDIYSKEDPVVAAEALDIKDEPAVVEPEEAGETLEQLQGEDSKASNSDNSRSEFEREREQLLNELLAD